MECVWWVSSCALYVEQEIEKAASCLAAFLVNAGDHLRSHTLTRAVPSAQRGLTSVFGMGTGGTLAVYSPANLETCAWRDLFSIQP